MKKLILYGMENGKGRLLALMWAGVLLLSLLISPLYAGAEICTAGIDYNQPIATEVVHTLRIKEDGAVVAVGGAGSSWDYGQFNVASWTNIKVIAAGGKHSVGLKQNGTVVAVATPLTTALPPLTLASLI